MKHISLCSANIYYLSFLLEVITYCTMERINFSTSEQPQGTFSLKQSTFSERKMYYSNKMCVLYTSQERFAIK